MTATFRLRLWVPLVVVPALAVTPGQVSGTMPYPCRRNVNRIKMIKRQMYGRAGFDLLRKRVLLAP